MQDLVDRPETATAAAAQAQRPIPLADRRRAEEAAKRDTAEQPVYNDWASI